MVTHWAYFNIINKAHRLSKGCTVGLCSPLLHNASARNPVGQYSFSVFTFPFFGIALLKCMECGELVFPLLQHLNHKV